MGDGGSTPGHVLPCGERQVGDTLAVIHFDQWASAHPVAYSTRADLSLLTAVTRQLS